MWDLPGPGLEPTFPALTDRFLTTVPPEKSHNTTVSWLLRFHNNSWNHVVLIPKLCSFSIVPNFSHIFLLPPFPLLGLFSQDSNSHNLKPVFGTSLMAQWLRIHLPMQGTWVWASVREDLTCHRATKPVCHNYRAHMPHLLKPEHLEPTLRNTRSHHSEKPGHLNEE